MLLAAEKHRQDAHELRIIINREVKDRAIFRDIAQAGHEVRQERALVRGFSKSAQISLYARHALGRALHSCLQVVIEM